MVATSATIVGDCELWSGYVGRHGYGTLSYKGKRWRAHRLSYYLHYGVDPADMHVMHSCDNKICINPQHLSLGSALDNMRDKVAKNRQARGAKCRTRKSIPHEMCELIVSMRKCGHKLRQISEYTGIPFTTVAAILRRM
jgi:hypothetical protein